MRIQQHKKNLPGLGTSCFTCKLGYKHVALLLRLNSKEAAHPLRSLSVINIHPILRTCCTTHKWSVHQTLFQPPRVCIKERVWLRETTMYTSTSTHTQTHTYTHAHTHTYTRMCTHTYIHTHTHRMCVCACTCVCMCMYVCLYKTLFCQCTASVLYLCLQQKT